MVSPRAAEDLALGCYIAMLAVNLAYITNSLLNSSLGVYLALILAGKDPTLYLLTTVLACATVWLEIMPHPVHQRGGRRQLLSRNMSALSILILTVWFVSPLLIAETGLGAAVNLFREGRFIPLTALTVLLAGLLPQGLSYVPFVTRDMGSYALLALSPILVYAIWRVNLLGSYTSVAGALILIVAWALVVYEFKRRGV